MDYFPGIYIGALSLYPTVPKNVVESLLSAKVYTIEELFQQTPEQLSKRTGLPLASISNLILNVRLKQSSVMGCTVLDMHHTEQRTVRISTGSKSIDAILNGGIECGKVSHMYGASGCGLTQFIQTLAVTCQLIPVNEVCSLETVRLSQGGVRAEFLDEGPVCMILDTHNGIRAERIMSVAKRFGLDHFEAGNRVTVVKVPSLVRLKIVLKKVYEFFLLNRYRLLVIDSLGKLFQQEFISRNFGERYHEYNDLFKKLHFLASEFNAAVVVTNIQNADFANATKYYGGCAMSTWPNLRLRIEEVGSLNNQSPDERIIHLESSSYLQRSSCKFRITEGGVSDQIE